MGLMMRSFLFFAVGGAGWDIFSVAVSRVSSCWRVLDGRLADAVVFRRLFSFPKLYSATTVSLRLPQNSTDWDENISLFFLVRNKCLGFGGEKQIL